MSRFFILCTHYFIKKNSKYCIYIFYYLFHLNIFSSYICIIYNIKIKIKTLLADYGKWEYLHFTYLIWHLLLFKKFQYAFALKF